MIEVLLIYGIAKVVMTGGSWLILSSTRKNITSHIEALKAKPSSHKRQRTADLNIRLKLTKIITPSILIPGIGDVLFLAITVGRFSNKNKITKIYTKALMRIDGDNLRDAVDKIGGTNQTAYKTLKKNAGFLSVQGHSEIAKQSIITLNNLLIDANIAGINLRQEPSIEIAINDTAELISSLLREEQSGIQSNIDTYLNVVESIKSDLIDKKSVFIDTPGAADKQKK